MADTITKEQVLAETANSFLRHGLIILGFELFGNKEDDLMDEEVMENARCTQCCELVESGLTWVNKGYKGKIDDIFCSEACKDEWHIDNGQFGAGD